MQHLKHPSRPGGFSLLEMSVVLIIVGLIVGGVTVNREMIRAAELRRVLKDADTYKAAINTFRDKYLALPGDMSNATSFWGKDNTACPADSGAVAEPGTCNGDGDGHIILSGSAPFISEGTAVWNQLALAGIIEGTYDLDWGAGAYPETHAPVSALSESSYAVDYYGTLSGATWWYDGDYGHVIRFGIPNNNGGTFCPSCFDANPHFNPQDTWRLDTKTDDGLPGTGNIRAAKNDELPATCTSSINAANTFTATYQVDVNTLCLVIFLLGDE